MPHTSLASPGRPGEAGPASPHLEEAVRVIDRRRLEIRQEVFSDGDQRPLRYQVETWFFLPTSLQINRWSFDLRQYQQSLKNYIRFGVPVCPPEDLLARRECPGGKTFLAEAEDCLDLLRTGAAGEVGEERNTRIRARYADTLKRFGLLFRAAITAERRRLSHESDFARRAAGARSLAENAARCLHRYRALELKADEARPYVRVPTFLFLDEYLSLVSTEEMARLLPFLSQGASGSEAARRDAHRARAFWRCEMAYRRRHYPDSVPVEGTDNEMPVYRWSVLKKYVDRPLFLEVRPRQGTTLLAHSLYGLAAAMAMIFATAVGYIWQVRYGQLSLPCFTAIVIAYIFKDRIKDVGRDRLFKMFRRRIPDRRQVLYDGQEHQVGMCYEFFRFEDWDNLPECVRLLRNKTHLVEILNAFRSEDVLYYAKDMRVQRLLAPFDATRRSLLDITRFDIAAFLRHAVDALDELPGRSEDRLIYGEKIYHVDMVRRVSYGSESRLERWRIVLTRSGIRRIDEVVPLSPETRAPTPGEQAAPEKTILASPGDLSGPDCRCGAP